jgi:hypothetical protein
MISQKTKRLSLVLSAAALLSAAVGASVIGSAKAELSVEPAVAPTVLREAAASVVDPGLQTAEIAEADAVGTFTYQLSADGTYYKVIKALPDANGVLKFPSSHTDGTTTLPVKMIGNGSETGDQTDGNGTYITSNDSNDCSLQSGIKSVVFGHGIVRICNDSFSECSNLVSAVFPDTLTIINDWAFNNCALSVVHIPSLVSYIDFCLFSVKSNVIIDSGNSFYASTSDGSYAWGLDDGCLRFSKKTGDVVIPSGVIKILDDFYKEKPISSVAFPDSLTEIGKGAFRNCDSLTSVSFDSGLVSIGNDAFNDCDALTSVSFGTSLKTIGSSAFCDDDALVSVSFASSADFIGDYAFDTCGSLTSVSGPLPVSLGYSVFGSCSKLAGANVSGGCSYLFNGSYLLKVDSSTWMSDSLISSSCSVIGTESFVPVAASLKSLVIPSSITRIESNAFKGCNFDYLIWNPTHLVSGSSAFTYVKAVYYAGTVPSALSTVYSGSDYLAYARWYSYSETSNFDGYHWHYDADGKTPVVWAQAASSDSSSDSQTSSDFSTSQAETSSSSSSIAQNALAFASIFGISLVALCFVLLLLKAFSKVFHRP